MLHDAFELPDGYTVECDVCIVGAGAAGMALAHELRGEALKVVVLESGGERLEKNTQDLHKGEVADPERHAPLHEYRLRQLGGTTNVWGGRCAPYDAIDFEERPYVPHGRWPIGKKELDPYYERAHAYCDLGGYVYDLDGMDLDKPASMIPGFASDQVTTEKLWRWSSPTNFRKKYTPVLTDSPDVHVYTHANCLNISTTPDGQHVDHLVVATLEHNPFKVRAKHYVLAAGALEVTRLLLLSNDVHAEGIGNHAGLLGKFYMSHLSGDMGPIQFTAPNEEIVWNYEKTPSGVYFRRTFSLTEEAQREHGLLNFRAMLANPLEADPSHGNSVLSTKYFLKWLLSKRSQAGYQRAISGENVYRHLGQHLGNVARDPLGLLRFSSEWVRKRIIPERKLPSVALGSASSTYWLHYDAEQSPDPRSTVSLGREKDAFGLNRLDIDFHYAATDEESVVRSVELIAEAMERTGIGHLEADREMLTEQARHWRVASHHIGTTRMAKEASEGVVDADCRVFGVDNLYVASSSVLPTSSYANPTLTIVAIAIRVAEHLKQLQAQGAIRNRVTIPRSAVNRTSDLDPTEALAE